MQVWIWIFRFLCAGLALLAAFLLYRALLHDRSRGRRRCPRCWYDLSGVQGLLCPECGRESRRERSLLRTRRHYRRAALALVIAAAAYTAGLAPKAIRSGSWWAAVPTPVLVVAMQFYDDADDQLFQNMMTRFYGKGPKLSAWERLLLARRCGTILLEPTTAIPPTGLSALATPTVAPTTQDPGDDDALGVSVDSYTTQVVPGPPVPSALGGIPVISAFFGTTRQAQAVGMLEALGSDARAALPSLTRCINDPQSPNRYAAIRLVGLIGPQARSAVPVLARHLDDPAPTDSILNALIRLDTSAVAAAPKLRELLSSSAHGVNTTLKMVRVLHRTIPESELVDLLRRILNADRSGPPIGAARGLETIGRPAAVAIPDLARAARRHPESMTTTAIHVIASFGPVSVPALMEFVQTGTPDQQAAAAYWLGTLHQSAAPAAQVLITALSSHDPGVRTQAAHALGYIGDANAQSELTRLHESDPVAHVRATAAEALVRLKTP